jgi:hypothetical protein
MRPEGIRGVSLRASPLAPHEFKEASKVERDGDLIIPNFWNLTIIQ